jgi:hypothetical protein
MTKLILIILHFILVAGLIFPGCRPIQSESDAELEKYLIRKGLNESISQPNILILRVSGCDYCLEKTTKNLSSLISQEVCEIKYGLIGDTGQAISTGLIRKIQDDILFIDSLEEIDFLPIEFGNFLLIHNPNSFFETLAMEGQVVEAIDVNSCK